MRERASAMLDRVASEAGAVLSASDAAFVTRALAASLVRRDERVADEHDSRYLHPARTLRILIADAACRDGSILAAAAFVDTIDPDLVPEYGFGDVQPAAGRAAELLRSAPRPGEDAEGTLEALVVAPPAATLIALAERLDQVRHVHLRPDQSGPHHLHEVRAAYVPAARRAAPQLARRFERWADAFERRLLLRGRAGLP